MRIMGVSPSSHEPVRIAPMVRRCSSADAPHNGGFDDTPLRAAGAVEYSDHHGGGGAGAVGRPAPNIFDDKSRGDTSSGGESGDGSGGGSWGGSGGGNGTASSADVFYQRGEGAGFVVGRSRERLSAAACMARGEKSGDIGGAGRGLEAVAEKERDAADLVSVGYDEWKEACTAEGKM